MARPAPITPDQAALEIAHRKLRTSIPLDAALKIPSLRRMVETIARRHMKERARFDAKKHQAGDAD